jgi:hypothetical protein
VHAVIKKIGFSIHIRSNRLRCECSKFFCKLLPRSLTSVNRMPATNGRGYKIILHNILFCKDVWRDTSLRRFFSIILLYRHSSVADVVDVGSLSMPRSPIAATNCPPPPADKSFLGFLYHTRSSTVITTFPRACPAPRYRSASAASLNGNRLSITGTTLPASISSLRITKSF